MKELAGLCLLILGCNALPRQSRRFPDDFLFGTATAAYQIEGGWNADVLYGLGLVGGGRGPFALAFIEGGLCLPMGEFGLKMINLINNKGENIWDRMTHTKPNVIKDNSTGDIAADSYHNYKRDVEMMRELGLDAYRFSLSWPRILPNGFSNKISKEGVAFYNNYIDEMLKYNIKPMITLYHWDLPQKLQDMGGFMNPLFPEWFEDYARVAYEQFGDRVKFWITFNEPREICYEGYESTSKAPQLNVSDVGAYYCAKQLVLAHARAYRAYISDFKPLQEGVCGITISISHHTPATDSEEDRFATEMRMQAEWGLYAEPIFSDEGGFPKELENIVAKKSAEQGYPRSRMPSFTNEENDFVRGTFDFFGVNHYTSYIVSATEHKSPGVPVPSLFADVDNGKYADAAWPQSASSWLTQAPNSVYHTLTHLQKKYNNPVFYITENGWSTSAAAGLEDDDRVRYFRAAWESILDTLEAGVDLRGYMAWSLMDNFEWMEGYTELFGLYAVDFSSPNRTRTPRKSAFVYKHLISTRAVDHDYEPDTRTMWIDEDH